MVFASDSECNLQVIINKKTNSEISFDAKNPFTVFIGNNYQARFDSSIKALKLINFLQENNYCQQDISSQIPKCRTEFMPSDRVELTFYAVRAGEKLIDTIALDTKDKQSNLKTKKAKALEKAQEIINLLKQVRFCQ